MDSFQIENLGLLDDGIKGYKLTSEYSWIKFGKDESRNYILYMIGTNPSFRNQGHANQILDTFFRMIKKSNGNLIVETYTAPGEMYIRHNIEKLSHKYGVRILK